MKSLLRERLSYLLLLIIVFLSISCGQKGDPTLKSFEKPMAVKEIRAVHREDELVISWSYPAPEREKIKGFYIEKAEDRGQRTENRGQEFKNIAFFKNDVSQFVDKDFKIGKAYYYKIRVYGIRNVISNDSPVLKAMPSALPLPPAKLSYKVTNDSIEIKWNEAKGDRQKAVGIRYNIYKSYESGKYSASTINSIPLKEPFLKDRVETGKPVYYTVRSLFDSEIKDEGYPSEELEVNPESFIPSKPTGLKYVPSEKKVYLMWNENPETWTKGYRIYRKRISENEFRLIGEAVTPAFTDNTPLYSKTTYYITASGPKKESIPSDVVEVHPLVER